MFEYVLVPDLCLQHAFMTAFVGSAEYDAVYRRVRANVRDNRGALLQYLEVGVGAGGRASAWCKCCRSILTTISIAGCRLCVRVRLLGLWLAVPSKRAEKCAATRTRVHGG